MNTAEPHLIENFYLNTQEHIFVVLCIRAYVHGHCECVT